MVASFEFFFSQIEKLLASNFEIKIFKLVFEAFFFFFKFKIK